MLLVLEKQDSHTKMLDEMKADFKTQQRIRLNKHRQEILDSFGNINPEHYQETNLKLRQQATGDWFVRGPDFRKWMNTKNAKLWLHGIRTCLSYGLHYCVSIIEADRSLTTKPVPERRY